MDIEEIQLYRRLLLAQIEDRKATLSQLPVILLSWRQLGDSSEFCRADVAGAIRAQVMHFQGIWRYRVFGDHAGWKAASENTKECAMREADSNLVNVRFPEG